MEENHNRDKEDEELEDFCDCVEEIQEEEEDETTGENDKLFDFEKFTTYMKKSILEKNSEIDDVDLKYYLLAYEQLQNFFIILGKAFQFVSVDVKNKIKILQTFQKNEANQSESTRNFSSVFKMIDYEKSNDLFSNSKYVSGSRTLLRLHRGLDFVRKFLAEIYKLDTNEKLSSVAREVYNDTLAQYHSWIVKSASRMAMQFLPSKSELLKQMSGDNEEKLNQILEVFPEAMEAMNTVYDRTQHLYSINELLDLP